MKYDQNLPGKVSQLEISQVKLLIPSQVKWDTMDIKKSQFKKGIRADKSCLEIQDDVPASHLILCYVGVLPNLNSVWQGAWSA